MAFRYSTMASSTKRNSSYRPRSDVYSYTNAMSLPIRPAATPTHERPVPATVPSSNSTSSTSSTSSESSDSPFDHSSPYLGAESPTTPPEVSLTNDQSPKTANTIEQETPLPKVRRRSRRPPLTSVAPDPRYRARKASTSFQLDATTLRSETPPKFKPLMRANDVERSRTSSLVASGSSRSRVLRGHDVFMDTLMKEVEQAESSDCNSSEVPDEDNIGGKSSLDISGPVLPTSRTTLEKRGVDTKEAEEQFEGEDKRTTIANHQSLAAASNGELENASSRPNRFGFMRFSEEDKDMCFINENIVKIMNSTRIPKKSPGWTYIFESPKRAGHLKIGSTMKMNERERSLKRCEKEFVKVQDNDRNAFECHSIVEMLVHRDLHNKRRILVCKCGKTHNEWFEVKKDDALRSLRRWRTWIKVQKPYDKQWKLTPFWQWKVDNLTKTIAHVDWDRWVRPSRLEYCYYWYEEFGKDHCFVLQAHFKRKDERFLLVGFAWVLSVYVLFGISSSLWTFLGLIVI